MESARPRGIDTVRTDSARVIQVIETRSLAGIGTREDVYRQVTQYWDFEGQLLASFDPLSEQQVGD